MPRGRRALLRKQVEEDDEFETPAFKEVVENVKADESDSDDEPTIQDNEESSDDDSDKNIELDDNAGSSDDSDDAPEDVGFNESRKAALSKMKDVINQLQEEKRQLKTKRKLKDEKFKEQKKLKLAAVSRLSEDILNKLPEEINKPKKDEKPAKKNKKKKSKVNEDTDAKEKRLFVEESEDYIPLEAGFVNSETGIKAVSLKDLQKKMAISQSAANFRNSRLYGNKRNRETTQSYLSKVKKRKHIQR